MNRLVSLSHLTVIELSPPRMVEVAARVGYDLVDFRLAKAIPEDTVYPVFGDTPMRREIKRLLAETGLKVYDIELIRLRGDTALSDYEPLLEAGAELGAQRLKVSSADRDEAGVVERLIELCELCRPYGLTVDLEFVPFTEAKTLEQGVRMVQQARRHVGNCAVLIDTLHFVRSGSSLAQLRQLGQDEPSLFDYFQLCDAPLTNPPDIDAIAREARVERLIPGEGELPLADILRCLPADRPVSLELPMKAMAARLDALERARLSLAGARGLLERIGG